MSFLGFGYRGGEPLLSPKIRRPDVFSYVKTTPPLVIPVSLDFIKTHLKLDPVDTSQDDYLTTLINAAGQFFENFTNRILINTGFKTFFNCFMRSFEIYLSKLQVLNDFRYLVDGSLVDVDSSIYYVTEEVIYSRIIIGEFQDFPSNKDDVFQAIRVDFTAGFGPNQSDIPPDIQIALANHVAAFYENRGDCNNCDCGDISNLPTAVQNTYRQYQIVSSYGSSFR